MYIGIDIGGTNTRIGLFEDHKTLVKEIEFLTEKNYKKGLEKIVENIREIAGEVQIQGVGLGIGAVLDNKKENLAVCAQLNNWVSKPLKGDLEKHLNIKVVLENDAIAAAISESLTGKGLTSDKFIYAIWGTGVGGCLVERIDNKIKVRTSEWGHLSIDWKGRRCSCGQNGCLENYIGGKAFKELYGVNAEEIIDDKVWEEVAERAAFGIHNMVHILPVDLIIFGGGLITKQPHLLSRIKLKLEEELKVFSIPRLVLSDKSEKNGLYGAAGLFFVDMI